MAKYCIGVYAYLDTIRKFTAMLIKQYVVATTTGSPWEKYMDLSYSKCLNKQLQNASGTEICKMQ